MTYFYSFSPAEQHSCVACVAWQIRRDHIVRPRRRRRRRRRHRRRCRRHTFRFRSIIFEIIDFIQILQNLDHYKIQVGFDIGNHPPNFD